MNCASVSAFGSVVSLSCGLDPARKPQGRAGNRARGSSCGLRQEPPQPDDVPATVELSAGESSQNFGYMVQWWIFALIGAIGYPLILRRVARNRARGEQVPDDLPVDPSPSDPSSAQEPTGPTR